MTSGHHTQSKNLPLRSRLWFFCNLCFPSETSCCQKSTAGMKVRMPRSVIAGTTRLRWTLLLVLLPLGQPIADALVPSGLPTVDMSEQLLEDVADGQLDRMSVVRAALVAGGVLQPHQLADLEARFDGLCRRLEAQQVGQLPPAARAQALLDALHTSLLTGQYVAYCSRLDQTLSAGHYNCVTATVLYQALCERFGLSCRAIAVPGHVYSRVWLEGRDCDVQTTSRRGLDSHVASLQPDQVRSAADAVEKGAIPREIGPVQLLAKIYYNRGVARLHQRRFDDAIENLKISLRLDPVDPSARQNLLAGLNNWVLELCDQGQFAASAAKLQAALAIDPDYPPLPANDLHIHQRWCLALCRQGHFPEALELLEQCHQRRPDVELFDRGRLVVYRGWIQHLAARSDWDQARRLARQARHLGASPEQLDQWLLGSFEGTSWPADLTISQP